MASISSRPMAVLLGGGEDSIGENSFPRRAFLLKAPEESGFISDSPSVFLSVIAGFSLDDDLFVYSLAFKASEATEGVEPVLSHELLGDDVSFEWIVEGTLLCPPEKCVFIVEHEIGRAHV